MIRFPDETVDARAARLLPHFTIVRPEGDGPFPTCVMLHGCGRADGPQPVYARALARAGVASVLVDSFTPRAIDRPQAIAFVCSGMTLQGRRRAGDLIAALRWARAQDWVAADRLAAAGWSHGGWTVMDALVEAERLSAVTGLTDAGARDLDGLRHAFLVYPWCGPGSNTIRKGWAKPVPATMIIAGRDTISGASQPRAACAAARRSGAEVEEVFFPEATHSFDEIGVVDPRFRFDPALVAAAEAACVRALSGALIDAAADRPASSTAG